MTIPVGAGGAAPGPVPVSNADLLALVRQLQQQVTEMQRKTLFSASVSQGGLILRDGGSLSVLDADGDETFYVGGKSGIFTRPDGKPQPMFIARDDNGNARIAVFDPDPLSGGYQQAIIAWDHLGNIVFSTDIDGGLARPWVPIHMYPKIPPAAVPYQYLQVSNGLTHTELQVWEGRIPFVSHPRLQIDGVWGIASGASGTPTYNLKINGDVVLTWSRATLAAERIDAADISAYLNLEFAKLELTVIASGTGASIAAQVLGCALRQT